LLRAASPKRCEYLLWRNYDAGMVETKDKPNKNERFLSYSKKGATES